MKIDHLLEPELEFGTGPHIDIRFGLTNCGPVDHASPLAPKEIRVGIVGTNETVEGICDWLERCRDEITAKSSNQPNLFPKFPGFRPDTGFQSTLILDSQLQRQISPRVFADLRKSRHVNRALKTATDLFYSECEYLAERGSPQVLICAVPAELLELAGIWDAGISKEDDETEEKEETRESSDEVADDVAVDFHHLLKARAMRFRVPIQLVIPSTYSEKKRPFRRPDTKEVMRLQDEATRAWNFHTALYYKAKGLPWRLPRYTDDYTTCYVGVSFYQPLDKSALLTSVAQIFNERGEGVVVRGAQAKLAKEDRQPHLDAEAAHQLVTDSLTRYREEHKSFPARVVLHKSSRHNDHEVEGFLAAAREFRVELIDLLALRHSTTRLFRIGFYAPLRGTVLSLDERSHILYTRGSVDFFQTYPGLYVPMPLLFTCDSTEQTPRHLAQEILSLTKMNWNNTQFDGGDPITMHAARHVGGILKYVGKDDPMEASYRFYM